MLNIRDAEINPIGLGTWNIGENKSTYQNEVDAIRYAIDNGVNVIDTAEMYGNGKSEEIIGHSIKKYDREKLYIISKILPQNASKEKILDSIDNSLNRLGTDYIDLYLLHWKSEFPLEETINTFEKAKQMGKIRDWGVSNFDTSDMKHLLSLPMGRKCVANQVRYNLGNRGIEYDLKPYMQKHNISLISYAPLSRGDKLGKDLTNNPTLLKLSKKYKVSVFQILLSWLIRDDYTIAIPKSSNKEHIKDNLNSNNLILTKHDIQAIDLKFPPPINKESLALW